MRKLSAKLERWETAGDSDLSLLRGVAIGVLVPVEMAEELMEAVEGLSKGLGRLRACVSPDDEVGLDDEEATWFGCAIWHGKEQWDLRFSRDGARREDVESVCE